MKGRARIDTSEMNVIFVHSALDDAGLTPRAFRIYGHIARRAGNGTCFSAKASMAEHCGMDIKTVKLAIRELMQRGMLERIARTGDTTVYTLTPPSRWAGKYPGPENTLGQKTDHPPVQKTDHPLVQKTDHKGNPPKDIPEGNPLFVLEVEEKPVNPEVIYSAYPRKVGKPVALKAIVKALKVLPFDELLKRVQIYAQSVKGKDATFIPHPSTWFRQERYNDPTNTTNNDTDHPTFW